MTEPSKTKFLTNKTKLIKQISLGGITFFFFLLFWLFLNWTFQKAGEAILFFGQNILADYFLFIIFLSLLGILVVIIDFLVDNIWVVLSVYFLSSVFFLIFFSFRILYVLAVVILFLTLFTGYFRIVKEKKDRVKFSIRKVAKYGLPGFMTAMVLLSSVAYYYAVSKVIKVKGLQIPRQVFDKAVEPVGKVMPSFLPGFKKEASIEEIIYLSLINQMEKEAEQGKEIQLPFELINSLKKEKIDVKDKKAVFTALRENPRIKEQGMKLLLESQKGEDKNKGIEQTLKEFGISKEESFFDGLYKVVNQKVKEIAQPYLKYLPIIFGLIFFGTFKFISLFIVWAVYLLSWLLIKILIALKFVKLEKEQREVEVLKL